MRYFCLTKNVKNCYNKTMKKNVKEKESKRVFKCLERDEFSRRDMQQIVHLGRGANLLIALQNQ